MRKRLDFMIGRSRSARDLKTIRALDGSIPHIQELLTESGFEDGERVTILPTAELDVIMEAAGIWKEEG